MLDSEQTKGSSHLALNLLLRLARPHRRRVALLFALAVGLAALTATPPWLVAIAIDTGIPAARHSNYWPLVGIAIALAACSSALALTTVFWRKQAGEIGQLVVFELRRELFAKFQALTVGFHERMSSGRVIARLTSDTESVNALFGATLTSLLQTITFAVTASAMLVLDVGLALVAFAAFIPCGVLFAWVLPQQQKAFTGRRAAVAETTVQVVESLNGIRPVHAFRRERWNDIRFAEIVDKARIAERRLQVVRGIQWPTLELIFSLAALVIVLVGGLRISAGTLEIGVLTAFVLYAAQFFDPVVSIVFILDRLQQALAALGKIAEVIEEVPGVPEPGRPTALPNPVNGEIRFEGVSFAYETPASGAGTAELAIPKLDLVLEAGQIVAMLGATGAGKSTVAKLIARFYDPIEGRILLDGIDLRDLTERDLRRAVLMLTQEGFLFSGSVADNIRIGRPQATQADIEAAAKAMGADAFIQTLPEGYGTDVRKRGSRLSAGQRQMIAFARAFLTDPAVLVLDEATSALDIPTERAMQKALRTLLAGRTALIIAHRLSTVEIADRVLVLADGRIVDDGSPADLLSKCTGEFAALYRDGHGMALHDM